MIMMRTNQGGCTGIVVAPLISITHQAVPKHAWRSCEHGHTYVPIFICEYNVYMYVNVCISVPICDTYTDY